MNPEFLQAILGISLLTFVITSMLAMGLSLTLAQVLAPLRNGRLVSLALVANFVVVPALAWGAAALFGLSDGLTIGLILMGTAAGAPFLPKLAEVAKGNLAFSVGLMVMLMVLTVLFMPIALPLIIEGVEVNAWDIASSLIFLMLLPLAIGLVVKALWDDLADRLQPVMGNISSVAIALLLVAGVIANWSSIVGIIGTGGLAAILSFLVVSFVAGFFAGGADSQTKSVLGLGTAQRNLSAAFVVALQNFSDDPDVLTMVIVGGLVGLVILMPLAAQLGKREPTV
jgi:BASS family bile acid:Na+ symporter